MYYHFNKTIPSCNFWVSQVLLILKHLDNITYNLVLSRDHANKYRFGVVQQFVGHGVGRVFHSDPVILHYSKCFQPVTLLLCFHLFIFLIHGQQ